MSLQSTSLSSHHHLPHTPQPPPPSPHIPPFTPPPHLHPTSPNHPHPPTLPNPQPPLLKLRSAPPVTPRPLSPTDFENSAIMIHEAVDTSHQADPIELAGLFQGDIMLVPRDQLKELNEIPKTRSAMTDVHRRWPNGIIPYVISQTYDESERATIAKAMSEYHEKTCIRFVPRTIEKDYIHILKGDGCSSSVGRVKGAQPVSLGPGCLYVGIVMHEFMHVAGFWHEQSRSDRDNYITINKLNVQDGMWYNFEKYGWDKIQSLGVGYDLESIMHYGPYAFAKEGKPTIIPRETGVEMGQRRGFSKMNNEECVDNNEQYCTPWADRGECENNPVWMNVNCRKACRQCGKECQDHSVHCRIWMEAGECTENVDYMSLFCKKSCGLCMDTEAADPPMKRCEDKNRFCHSWAEMNSCVTNPDYMLVYCKKSCKQC
ncbi:putative zinc metalloproteinase [Penaeus vannamei]|uniref:Metalloendopeptidase n=1 Tax=Penaeus vannamei TaxID=6689 RepID=A0A3R7QDG9_PENVA|nr:putative zinc metalloproteinase [Penaeus vannamei]